MNLKDKMKWHEVKDALNSQIIGQSELKTMDCYNFNIGVLVNTHLRNAISEIEIRINY